MSLPVVGESPQWSLARSITLDVFCHLVGISLGILPRTPSPNKAAHKGSEKLISWSFVPLFSRHKGKPGVSEAPTSGLFSSARILSLVVCVARTSRQWSAFCQGYEGAHHPQHRGGEPAQGRWGMSLQH